MSKTIRPEMFASTDVNISAEHVAAIIDICYEQIPALFAPGAALHAILQHVSDFGYTFGDEAMREIFRLAVTEYGAPAEVVKQMLDTWDTYRRVYGQLE